MKTQNTFASILLQFVRDNPGITGQEIHKHFKPEVPKNSISSTLARFRRMGLLSNGGNSGPRTKWYPVIFEIPDPEILEEARGVLWSLKQIPPSERERCLALYLQRIKIREI